MSPQDIEALLPYLSRAERDELETILADDLASVALDLLASLQRVHGAGLLHLDVKPSNVLLTLQEMMKEPIDDKSVTLVQDFVTFMSQDPSRSRDWL